MAKALASEWAEAIARISMSGDLENWLQKDLNDHAAAERYLGILRQFAPLKPSAKLSLVIATLDPALPPMVDGKELTPKSLITLAQAAVKSPELWPDVLRQSHGAFACFANLTQSGWLKNARGDWFEAQAQASKLDTALRAQAPSLKALNPADDLELLLLVLDKTERARLREKLKPLVAQTNTSCRWIRGFLEPDQLSPAGLWLLDRRISEALATVSPRVTPPEPAEPKKLQFGIGVVVVLIMLAVALRQCGGTTQNTTPDTSPQQSVTQSTASDTQSGTTETPPASTTQSAPDQPPQIPPIQETPDQNAQSSAAPSPSTQSAQTSTSEPPPPVAKDAPPPSPPPPQQTLGRDISEWEARAINVRYRDTIEAYRRQDCAAGDEKARQLWNVVNANFGTPNPAGKNGQSIQAMRNNITQMAQKCGQSPALDTPSPNSRDTPVQEITDQQAKTINVLYGATLTAYRQHLCTAGDEKATLLWHTVYGDFGTLNPTGKNGPAIQKMHNNIDTVSQQCSQGSSQVPNAAPSQKDATVNDWLNAH